MIPEELTDRLLDLAVAAGKLADSLPETPLGQRVSRELVRSATSAGPAYEEAVAAERRGEFTRQLNDALAELRATRYWLRLADRANLLTGRDVQGLLDQCRDLGGILDQSITTARVRAWREGQFSRWQALDVQFTMYALPFATIAMGFRGQPLDAPKPKPPAEAGP